MSQKFPGPQTGMDYARLTTTLAASKTQSSNNELFQTIQGLISGAKDFQGFLEGRYNALNSDLSRLFNTVSAILAELSERDSTKYSISLTNGTSQAVADSKITVCTFDTTIYDDGLMFVTPSSIIVNANAQFLVTGRIQFPSGSGLRRVAVMLNNRRQFSTEFDALDTNVIVPFAGVIECLQNDTITLTAYQQSGKSLSVIPSIQAVRVTFVNLGSGRNKTENESGTSGNGNGSGGGPGSGGCDPVKVPPPIGPSWYISLIASHSVSNCWNTTDMAACEADFNALNYWYQRSSGGAIRGRMFYPTPTSYDHYVDLPRPDGGWGWDQHGF